PPQTPLHIARDNLCGKPVGKRRRPGVNRSLHRGSTDPVRVGVNRSPDQEDKTLIGPVIGGLWDPQAGWFNAWQLDNPGGMHRLQDLLVKAFNAGAAREC